MVEITFPSTDMAKNAGSDGSAAVGNWLRNKNTLELLATWESLYNPNFNSLEFEGLRSRSGSNAFTLSPTQWVEKTQAIGIVVKMGRYGAGVFGHQDIALEFATWLSPKFKLYVLKEFNRLKQADAQRDDPAWNMRRILSKVNYQVHTDAVKEIIIPTCNLPISKEGIAYADEAELLNRAVFGMTSQEWQKLNPTAAKNGNIRDHADITQLTILSNLESSNATYLRDGLNKHERFFKLSETARYQYDSLTKSKLLAQEGKVLMQGLRPLDAPRPPPQEKPPATGKHMATGFKQIKDAIAKAPDDPRKNHPRR